MMNNQEATNSNKTMYSFLKIGLVVRLRNYSFKLSATIFGFLPITHR